MRQYALMLAIAAILQTGIYLYMDRVVLMPSASFSQQTIAEEDQPEINHSNMSLDHKYYAELQATGVRFFNNKDLLTKEFPLQVDEKVTFFSWVQDSHLALIGFTKKGNQGTSVVLKPIDPDADSYPPETIINGLSSDSKISEVAFSLQIPVAYVLVKANNSGSVYRIDVNQKPGRVYIGSSVWRIAGLQNEEMLLYDNRDGRVYGMDSRGKRKTLTPGDGKYTLIGTDRNDNLYIGRLSSPGSISTVLKGNISGGFIEYQNIDPPQPADLVTVNYYGTLVLN